MAAPPHPPARPIACPPAVIPRGRSHLCISHRRVFVMFLLSHCLGGIAHTDSRSPAQIGS